MAFKDTFGVEYSDDRQTLLKCPTSLVGSYTVSPMTATIGKEAFKGCDNLEELILSSNIKTIQANAFDECKTLNKIHFDGSVNEWLSISNYSLVKRGYDLYIKDQLLTSVVIDGDIKEVKNYAFYYCRSLKHIEIHEGVKCIGNSAFNKTNISGDVYLPDSIEKIGDFVFVGCYGLKSVSIPYLSKIGKGVFLHCSSLDTVEVRGCDEANNNCLFSKDGVLFERSTFKNVLKGGEESISVRLVYYPRGKNATSYHIPDSILSIGDYAFAGVQNLTLVYNRYIPAGLYAFENSKIKFQVPLGLRRLFVIGTSYPKDAIEEIWKPQRVNLTKINEKPLCLVANNPYRLLGVATNAPEKEISANKTKITRFVDVGKKVDFPLDFAPLLGECGRDKNATEKASSALCLPQDKIKHALFWFAKESPIDEMVLEYIKAGNIEKANGLLEKRESWSALMNKGVLSFITGNVPDGVSSVLKVIHNNDYKNSLLLATCGEAFVMSEIDLSHLFINLLKTELTEKALLLMLFENGFTEEVDYLKGEIIGSIQAKINSEIDKASKTNPDDAEASYQAGVALMNNTKQALMELRQYLSTTDMQYQSIADNVAKRILQCSINYHNAAGTAVEYEKALSLAKYAESIAEGNLAKERCVNNLRAMNENFVLDKLKTFNGDVPSLKTAQKLVDDCVPNLNSIKKVMGEKDDSYLELSSSVANCALGMLIMIVNDSQKHDTDRQKSIVVEEALKVMGTIGKLDMTNDERQYYMKNNNTLKSLRNPLFVSYPGGGAPIYSSNNPTQKKHSSTILKQNSKSRKKQTEKSKIFMVLGILLIEAIWVLIFYEKDGFWAGILYSIIGWSLYINVLVLAGFVWLMEQIFGKDDKND